EVLRYPLVLCDPEACEGHAKQIEHVLRKVDMEPLIAERVASSDLMMALVSAGFALGLAAAEHIAAGRDTGVVARPLAGRSPPIITYLLYPDNDPSETLSRFIERVQVIGASEEDKPAHPMKPDALEGIEP